MSLRKRQYLYGHYSNNTSHYERTHYIHSNIIIEENINLIEIIITNYLVLAFVTWLCIIIHTDHTFPKGSLMIPAASQLIIDT